MDRRCKTDELYPKKRDEQGRALCRKCGVLVPKGRRWWCSDECVRIASYNFDPQEWAKAVYQHHKGICCHCGMDLKNMEAELRHALSDMQEFLSTNGSLYFKTVSRWGTYQELIVAIYGGHGTRRRVWDAHHIKPVAEGGQNTMENGSLLCIWCHKKYHAEQKTKQADLRKSNMVSSAVGLWRYFKQARLFPTTDAELKSGFEKVGVAG